MSGYRGGWSNTLTTENLLNNPGEQFSLTEDLRDGVASAHRQQVGGEREFRNIRRAAPLKVDNIVLSKTAPDATPRAEPAPPSTSFHDRLRANKAPSGG